MSYIWFNELSEDKKKINISISFFEKQGETYVRFNEEQTQYIHSESEIVNALTLAGFKDIQLLNKNGEKPSDIEERLLFIAKK